MQKRFLRRALGVTLVISSLLLSGCCLSTMVVQQAYADTGAIPAPSAVKGERDKEIYNFITAKSKNPDKVLIRFSCTERNFEDTAETRGEREFFRSLKE